MKLALSWFCIVHLALVSAMFFTRNDLHATSGNSLSDRRAQAHQSAGALNHGRQRPLFARRGQYERQRTHKPKPKAVPVPPSDLAPPSKEAPKPAKPNCSQLTQSCLPQSGCCDPCASCRCRFFNAICFCWKTNQKNT
ncbi:agouti-signaling protein-like [Chelmon rostratus]|uniref:agouti-signaling protein-like n=1 Tax=Chelmon rostratus TaxID=109905 RepID=UPI001BE7D9E4|nr:agouti-signaling protein-like [Chelmon rostratus]